MSDSCKDHGQAVLVGHVNGVLVTDRTTWLDDSLDTCSCNFFHVISKWEEGVRRQNGSLQTVLGLLDSDTDGRYTVGLPRPHAQSHLVIGDDDAVGLDIFRGLPSELHGCPLLLGRLTLGHHLPVHWAFHHHVLILHQESADNACELFFHFACILCVKGQLQNPKIFLLLVKIASASAE